MSNETSYDRRRFLQAAGAAMATGFVAGCGDKGGIAGDGTSGTKRGAIPAAFADAGVDWRAHAGEEIRGLFVEHWWVDAVMKRLPEFTELTGIKVRKPEVLAQDAYFQKALVSLSSHSSAYDLLMVGNLQAGQYQNAGWLASLDDYVKAPFVDPKWYDLKDFFAPAIDVSSDDDGLVSIPVSAEAEVLMYRRDLLGEAGITSIRTFDELLVAARKLNQDDVAGFVSRGRSGLDIVWCWSGFFVTLGGRFFDAAGKPAVDSPAGIRATELFVEKLLRDNGPRGAANMTYVEAQGAFDAGKAAIYADASGLVPGSLDPAKNKHAKDIGVFRWPTGGAGPARPDYWYWMVGIPAESARKDAAALFILWATSKATSSSIGRESGTPSSRQSVWKDPKFKKFYPRGVAGEISKNLNAVDPALVPFSRPSFPKEVDRLGVELANVLTGSKSPEKAMADAAENMAKAS